MTALAATLRTAARGRVSDSIVLVLIAMLLLIAIFGPFIAPDSVYRSDILNALQPPNGEHWFGTDDQGRDVFWRVIAGSQATLISSVLIVTGFSLIGILVATLATIGPRWLDGFLMRICDIGLALPGLVVALGFAAALGPSLESAIIAKVITGWPMTARFLRAVMRETMTAPFVTGAKVLGVSRTRLMLRHVLPNSLDVLVVKWAGDIGTTILILAAMSFIGVGAQPPSAEWGAMIAAAKGYVSSAWWVVAAPGFAIALTSIAFGLLGDMLQVWRDPNLRNR